MHNCSVFLSAQWKVSKLASLIDFQFRKRINFEYVIALVRCRNWKFHNCSLTACDIRLSMPKSLTCHENWSRPFGKSKAAMSCCMRKRAVNFTHLLLLHIHLYSWNLSGRWCWWSCCLWLDKLDSCLLRIQSPLRRLSWANPMMMMQRNKSSHEQCRNEHFSATFNKPSRTVERVGSFATNALGWHTVQTEK